MDILKKNLHILGFSEEEIIIYLAALEEGSTTPLSLARNTGIPRTTVYLLIESLVNKKLLKSVEDGTKKSYIPVSPEELIRIAQQQKLALQETVLSLRQELPQLQALFDHTQHKPKIYYVFGAEEALKALQNLSTDEKIYILRSFTHPETSFHVHLEKIMTSWEESLTPIDELLIGDKSLHEAYITKFSTARHMIRTVSMSADTEVISIISGETTMYIITNVGHEQVVTLHDPYLSQFERIRFHALWDKCGNG